jgi:hypothetical protein
MKEIESEDVSRLSDFYYKSAALMGMLSVGSLGVGGLLTEVGVEVAKAPTIAGGTLTGALALAAYMMSQKR